MADNKKYYYMKLKDNFFESDEMIALQSLKDGYIYSDILLKMYLKSLKTDGKLSVTPYIPMNEQMLATFTRHTVSEVHTALEIFKQLNLIEILDNGEIYMLDIQSFIGQSSSEADRKRAYRLKIEEEKKLLLGQMSGQMSDKRPPEIRDKRLDIKENIKRKEKKEDKRDKKEKDLSNLLLILNNNIFFEDKELLKNKIEEWLKYKKEKRDYYSETGFNALLTQIENNTKEYGEEIIKELITESMANNYKGIIFNKLKNNNFKTQTKEVGEWKGGGFQL